MEKLNLFLILLAITFTACQSDANKSSTTAQEEEAVTIIEENTAEEVFNESDLDFESALEAFEEGDKEAAADYIEIAIEDLSKEAEYLEERVKSKVLASTANLKELAKTVRAGKITDTKTMEIMFAQAEMTVAHDYLIFSDLYAIEQPAKSESALEKAILRMENAVLKLEGESKKEADKMLSEAKKILEKGDAKAEKTGVAVGKQVAKMEAWLGRHAAKLGIKPGYDPNE